MLGVLAEANPETPSNSFLKVRAIRIPLRFRNQWLRSSASLTSCSAQIPEIRFIERGPFDDLNASECRRYAGWLSSLLQRSLSSSHHTGTIGIQVASGGHTRRRRLLTGKEQAKSRLTKSK